jgi:hypothetical protein
MQTVLFVTGQVVGLAAVLLGVFILAGLGWALVVGGSLVLVGATAMEAALLRLPGAPADRRGAPAVRGVR